MAMLPINPEKLQKAVTASGHTLVSASQAIGRGSSFLSNCKTRAKIDSMAADFLEDRLNISKELYTVQETFTPEEPEQLAFTNSVDLPGLVVDIDRSNRETMRTVAEILEQLKALRRELVHVVDYLDDQAKKAAGWMDDPDF